MRVPILGAVAVLAVVALSCGGPSSLPPGAAFLPSDSVFVLSLDLPALAATDLYKELQQRGGRVGMNRMNFYRFAEAAGLDPAKDVRWITLIGRGHEGAERPVDELSAVVSGTFDGKKMYGVLKDSGMPHETHGGTDIFQMVIIEGRCRFCIAVFDDTTAAFGDGDTLAAMAEARAAPERALRGDAGAARLLARVPEDATIWGLVRGAQLTKPLAQALAETGSGSAAGRALSGIQDISFFAVTGETIIVAADAVAESDEDALAFADILKGAGSLGKLALKQAKPDAADLLADYRVNVDGRLLRASASLPQARLVELTRTAAERFFAGMPGGPPPDDAPAPEAGPGPGAPAEAR